jgi:cell wall-associated NlpC family hydrolase
MRLATSLLVLLASLVAAPAARAAASLGTWNVGEQRAVAGAGLLPRLADGALHGERALTPAQLAGSLQAVAARTGQPPVTASVRARGPVSVTMFDARLVAQLGLADVAAHVRGEARLAGLRPPATFGTEVVARFLGLRTNHPAAQEALERYPWDPITRAEAAHSLAEVLRFAGWELADARARLEAFALPAYAPRARTVLRAAVGKVGMPYVWGGETDGAGSWYGYQAHGGYDCSGLVWRLFKMTGNPAGAAIHGRTAAQMAGEVPRSARIRLNDIRPGDLLFFGSAGFGSAATERGITHVGIALSAQWMLHASSQGVYVSSLAEPRRRDAFAWARRVL